MEAADPTTNILPTSKYDLFNLVSSRNVTQGVSLRLGIANLFNKQAPIDGAQPGVTDGEGTTNPTVYDVLRRRFSLGVTARL